MCPRDLPWLFKATLSRTEWQPGTRGHPSEPHHYGSRGDSVHALPRCPQLSEMHCACCQGFGAWPGPCQQCLFLQGAWPLYNHKKIMQRNVFLLKRPPHATQSFSEQRFALASGFAEIFWGLVKELHIEKENNTETHPPNLWKKKKPHLGAMFGLLLWPS